MIMWHGVKEGGSRMAMLYGVTRDSLMLPGVGVIHGLILHLCRLLIARGVDMFSGSGVVLRRALNFPGRLWDHVGVGN